MVLVSLGAIRVDGGDFAIAQLSLLARRWMISDERVVGFKQCSQASRPPCRHLQDSSPVRLGRLSQAVGQGRPSFGKDYRLRG